MKLEIWSDIACPFCYIGKRHLERALERFDGRKDVQITWKSYELNPDAEPNVDGSITYQSMLEQKFGGSQMPVVDRVTTMARQAGLDFQMDRAIPTNTFDAHRLIHFAATRGRQSEMKERLLAAHFLEGRHVGRHEELIALAEEVGLNGNEASNVLEGEQFGYEVRSDEQEARSFGITGVPCFVFNREFAVNGAQPVEAFLDVLNELSARAA